MPPGAGLPITVGTGEPDRRCGSDRAAAVAQGGCDRPGQRVHEVDAPTTAGAAQRARRRPAGVVPGVDDVMTGRLRIRQGRRGVDLPAADRREKGVHVDEATAGSNARSAATSVVTPCAMKYSRAAGIGVGPPVPTVTTELRGGRASPGVDARRAAWTSAGRPSGRPLPPSRRPRERLAGSSTRCGPGTGIRSGSGALDVAAPRAGPVTAALLDERLEATRVALARRSSS